MSDQSIPTTTSTLNSVTTKIAKTNSIIMMNETDLQEQFANTLVVKF